VLSVLHLNISSGLEQKKYSSLRSSWELGELGQLGASTVAAEADCGVLYCIWYPRNGSAGLPPHRL
jgi:hypothetical protein